MYLHELEIPNQGSLHRLENEKDACGVGMVASIPGEKSFRVLETAIRSVCNVTHRGAVDADGKTGDGTGILSQIPFKIFGALAEERGAKGIEPANLGVGVFFLPTQPEQARQIMDLSEDLIRSRGVTVLGWRDVPVRSEALGEIARCSEPVIKQLLLQQQGEPDADKFERELYLCRKQITRLAKKNGISGFYIPSLSGRMISYKALAVATGLPAYYDDLKNKDFETAICLYHQRFSTNTFPTWALCHPFRMLSHNGEINTVRGNRNWITAREGDMQHEIWGEDIALIRDVIDHQESDSASLDAALELLVLSGRRVEHAMSMLIPPAWRANPFLSEPVKAFYQYHRSFSEPWDGPAAVCFTDGRTVAATLDRNGLRPARYKITQDGLFSLGSEVGVAELPDEIVVQKGRLAPGEMLSIDTTSGRFLGDQAIREELAAAQPYGEWIRQNRTELDQLTTPDPVEPTESIVGADLVKRQLAFDISQEEIKMAIQPMAVGGQEAVHSMGDDIPLSILSHKPRLLSTYFKQLFAQVTNPPIDPIRERLVMSLAAGLGPERNILKETPEHAKVLNIESPILFEHQIEAIQDLDEFPCQLLDLTWPVAEGAKGLEPALDALCQSAEEAVEDGKVILLLSDRGVSPERVALPALLAVGAVHHHLSRKRTRMRCSLVVETGEVRDPHQLAVTFGYGATAICPYLGYASIRDEIAKGTKDFQGVETLQALKNYRYGLEKGLLKIMSKIGIGVLNSYQGAQIFEAIGLGQGLVDRCFTGTHSKIDGIGFLDVGQEALQRHFSGYEGEEKALGDPGYNIYRRSGETHVVDPGVIKNFHTFVKSGKSEDYDDYVKEILKSRPVGLKDVMEWVPAASGPVPIDEVEPIEDIRSRFTTAAMSMGALSPEAHETLAIAMNRIGGKSDSGEGGEDPKRFTPWANGDWANSKIKQIASGRFGVSAEYLVNAEELEIKMAQGAKPGEGGQLPAHKVTGVIAKLRKTQPGVQLISPPPHHDIYSIEDLAQLIHDLKEVNPKARVCVKLVAETGVGTIAAGVAKANADIILVSGWEGGTGASPLSSIKHAGLPWELGVAETQQVLLLNGLRDRITLRTDGGLRTGQDIITAAILGAEEYNFGTIALIAMGCVYVRKCHLNVCPVGVATTSPKFRAKFKGTPEMVVNFFNGVAEECRQIMANLGVRRLNDLIGRPEFLRQREVLDHPKANTISLAPILKNVTAKQGERYCVEERNDGIHEPPLDDQILLDAREAIAQKTPVELSYPIRNTHRNIGTKLTGEIARRYGDHGLPEGTISLRLRGSAGQSFCTFLCGGIKIELSGEANDYVGKGMCGGEIIIKPSDQAHPDFVPHANSIVGNTVMYGATGGYLFANGRGGERFCVRNSGGTAVVEGIGDHGCEYMTNGLVVVLGGAGKNFGAGMSGGTAYIYDENDTFHRIYNDEMVEPVALEDPEDIAVVKQLITRHQELTGSPKAQRLLDNWETTLQTFLKVQPKGKKPAAKVEPVAAAVK
ncbi:MAG: glutamate synthase large subunit [Verrucomicrobiota bacterium]